MNGFRTLISSLARGVAERLAFLGAPRAGPEPPPHDPRRIVVVRLGRLGDILLADPLLAALEEAHPRARIELLVDDLDTVPPWIDDLTAVTTERIRARRGADAWRRPGDPGLKRSLETIRARWSEAPPDALLLANELDHSTLRYLAARLARAAPPTTWKAGLVPGAGDRSPSFLNRSLPLRREHEIQKLLRLAELLGADPVFRLPRVPVDTSPPFSEAGGERVVVIHPGASRPSRIWPTERWGRVIPPLLEDSSVRMVVVGSAPEARLGRAMGLDGSEERVANRIGQTDLRELAELVGRGDLFVGTDSFPFHLAVALRRRVLLLPGPGAKRYRDYPESEVFGLRHLGESTSGGEDTEIFMGEEPAPELDELQPETVLKAIREELAVGPA